jgi:hypothetical protein
LRELREEMRGIGLPSPTTIWVKKREKLQQEIA